MSIIWKQDTHKAVSQLATSATENHSSTTKNHQIMEEINQQRSADRGSSCMWSPEMKAVPSGRRTRRLAAQGKGHMKIKHRKQGPRQPPLLSMQHLTAWADADWALTLRHMLCQELCMLVLLIFTIAQMGFQLPPPQPPWHPDQGSKAGQEDLSHFYSFQRRTCMHSCPPEEYGHLQSQHHTGTCLAR